jgi:hypothetical protein
MASASINGYFPGELEFFRGDFLRGHTLRKKGGLIPSG